MLHMKQVKLIKNHLILSDFAFKKDIEDDSIIRKISETIETSDRLNALFLPMFLTFHR